MSNFVHIHVHSEFSILDGACRTKDLATKAKSLGMPAVALTDHGNLFGAIEFYKNCKDQGVKPIIGCEVYLASGKMSDKKGSPTKDTSSHFLLLAKNEIGYYNLLQIVTAAHLEGFHDKPRIDKELLAKYAKGLIGSTACLKSEINQAILKGSFAEAEKSIDDFKQIFEPGDFYLEMHHHGQADQIIVNRALKEYSKKFNLPLVAANNVHYIERSHSEAHDILLCIGTGAQATDEKRLRFPSSEFYFKTAEEMSELFQETPEAIQNTLEIAEKSNLKIELGVNKFPEYLPPEGHTTVSYLRDLCEKGLEVRYGERAKTDVKLQERLQFELGILEKTGFTSYFLITWDFIHYAKTHGIPVGPGRGSAAGSIISYVLSITDLDPLRYGLFFERFLNPERVSPPDVDVDFCYNRRPEVIQYVREKYGHNAVSQIITYGTLGAKMVVRDVARVLGASYTDADRLSKMIPKDLTFTLNPEVDKQGKAIGGINIVPELKAAYENEDLTRQIIDFALPLEGLTRQVGVHAAGVVISDKPLVTYIPLTRDDEGNVITQYSMDWLGKVGMLKMDFLGLKTLTVIQEAFDRIKADTGEVLTMDQIPIDDKKTYDMLQAGKTMGVFQLESGGMVNACRLIKPERIEDLIALVALYRPGPMEFIPLYAERKAGTTNVEYPHLLLKEILEETYGVIIYQEQVMQAAQILAGYTLGAADVLRRAMGKKDPAEMDKQRAQFITGAQKLHQIPAKNASEIFDILDKFAGYGFNKAHAACYGYLAYITAYLKANYTVHMMASLMSNDLNNLDKIAQFIEESKNLGITIASPHVNESEAHFSTSPQMIRFGLAAIKNAGENAVHQIIKARKQGGAYHSLSEICSRVEARSINKKTLESLIKSGACDCFGSTRSQLFSEIDQALASATRDAKDKEMGQGSLLDFLDEKPGSTAKNNNSGPILPEWPTREKLAFEKELIGIYLSGHPLEDYLNELSGLQMKTISQLTPEDADKEFRFAGILTKVEVRMNKDNKPWARCQLEDQTGSFEILSFTREYEQWEKPFQSGDIVVVHGAISNREEVLSLRCREILSIETARTKIYQAFCINLPLATWNSQKTNQLHNWIQNYPGGTKLRLRMIDPEGRYAELEAKNQYGVEISPLFLKDLKTDFPELKWKIVAPQELPKRESKSGFGGKKWVKKGSK